MRTQVVLSLGLAALVVASCTDETVQVSTRSFGAEVSETARKSPAEARLLAQARSLDAMTGDIIKAATVKGAGIGAVAGCSLALVSAATAQRCVAGAVVGGLAGGMVGKAQGERQVAQRMQLVSRDDLARSLSRVSARLGSIRQGMTEVLEAQNAEMQTLKMQLAAEEISKEHYDARLAQMSETREILANALLLTADQAGQARASMIEAKASGQDGLEWHLEAVEEIKADAVSARSGITLL